MPADRLTPDEIAQYDRDGYLFRRGLLTRDETDALLGVARADKERVDAAGQFGDAAGNVTKLWLAHTLGEDPYSAVARLPRVVGPMRDLLREKPLHFHHKMMLKEPKVGGAWEWHQDYGYWYRHEGFLFPELASCMIAADKATRENGCLQVLRGSHRCGRIEHGDVGRGQTGAELARVEALKEHLELVHVELEPGDALFFHSNTLHASAPNRSDNPRWSLIACYAAADNPAIGKAPRLNEVDPISDEAFHALMERHIDEHAAVPA